MGYVKVRGVSGMRQRTGLRNIGRAARYPASSPYVGGGDNYGVWENGICKQPEHVAGKVLDPRRWVPPHLRLESRGARGGEGVGEVAA